MGKLSVSKIQTFQPPFAGKNFDKFYTAFIKDFFSSKIFSIES